MNKFLEFWMQYRKPIGISVGIFNLLTAALFWYAGNTMIAAFWFCIGIFILMDVWND